MIRARLDLEPADAVRYFAGKGEQLAWDYTELWREANAHAFTVAKVTSTDLLRAIRAEVAKAIGKGQTFEDFKRTLRPRLQDLGWWGTQEVLDADNGELTRVHLGMPGPGWDYNPGAEWRRFDPARFKNSTARSISSAHRLRM